jgi:hypothetical protein
MAGLDDTENEEASVGNHLGKLRERMGAAKAELEDTDEVSVETPEPDDDEDDDKESEVAPTRRERRANRSTARERAAAAEAEAKVLREQLAMARAPERQAGPPPAVADVDRRIRATYTELERLEEEFLAAQNNKTLTPAREREMRDRAQELEIQKMELAAERREVQTAPQRRQKELWDQLARDNSDVYDHPQARQYAQGRAVQLIALGHKDNRELHDKVMAEAREVVLKVRPKPDAIDRQRAAGMSAGPRAVAQPGRATISMPKGSHYYKMAVALYPDLEPAQACQKWAQGPGKKLVASRG